MWRPLTSLVLSMIGYLVASFLFEPVLGKGTPMLATVPVAVLAWVYGPRWGAASATAAALVDVVIFPLLGRFLIDQPAQFALGHGMLLLLAVGIGFVSEMVRDLARSREILQAAVDCQLLCRADDGLIIEANRAALSALGLSEKDVVGRLRLAEIAPFISEQAVDPTRTSYAHRGVFRRPDGEELPVNVSVSRFSVRGEEMLVVHSRSIRAELELQDRLLAAERLQIAADAEAQVLRANRLAQIGTMAAGIAHEINNPLTFIVASQEHVQDEHLPVLRELLKDAGPEVQRILADVDQLLDEAVVGADRIQRVTEELKLFARTPEGSWAPADLAQVVRVSLRMARHNFEPGTDLVEAMTPGCMASVDEAKLGQVVINLLTNAAHAMHGRPDPRVDLRVFRDGASVVIEVEDNGVGIPRENLDRIFSAFFTTKPVGAGTGLGLSVCRSIVAELGGDLDVESEVGVGTLFTVRLPAVEAVVPASSLIEIPTLKPTSARRLKVLVIDDEPMLRGLLARMLSAHDVTAAASSDEALELLEAERWDAVLCDLVMPVQTGMDLYREVEAKDPAQAARFVFISGGAVSPEAHAFARIHEERLLPKPVTAQRVRAEVLLAASRTGRHEERCPMRTRCPVFPEFARNHTLHLFDRHFCGARDGGHGHCARFQSVRGRGVVPPPWLLPDGGRMEPAASAGVDSDTAAANAEGGRASA